MAEFYKFTRESNLKCQELLHKSIERDPEFAGAYSRLAYAIVLSMVYFDAAPDDARMDQALVAARRAIELDDHDANGHFTIGRVHLARCEYDLAIDALQHALELTPCLAVTYCGLGDSLAYEGRLDEAIEQFEIAIQKQAQSALDDLIKAKPEFSLEFARQHLFYLKRSDQLESYIDGLRKAGVT